MTPATKRTIFLILSLLMLCTLPVIGAFTSPGPAETVEIARTQNTPDLPASQRVYYR